MMKRMIVNWCFRAEGGTDRQYSWPETAQLVRHELAFLLWRIAPNRLGWLVDWLDPFR